MASKPELEAENTELRAQLAQSEEQLAQMGEALASLEDRFNAIEAASDKPKRKRERVIPTGCGAFWLSKPRYLKQATGVDKDGNVTMEPHERYLKASPRAPVKVVLPLVFKRTRKDGSVTECETGDAFLKSIKPKPPKDVHPNRIGGQPNVAQEVHDAQEKTGVRAADQ
jgi:hypothetical protein